jgi:hypothetical protein
MVLRAPPQTAHEAARPEPAHEAQRPLPAHATHAMRPLPPHAVQALVTRRGTRPVPLQVRHFTLVALGPPLRPAREPTPPHRRHSTLVEPPTPPWPWHGVQTLFLKPLHVRHLPVPEQPLHTQDRHSCFLTGRPSQLPHFPFPLQASHLDAPLQVGQDPSLHVSHRLASVSRTRVAEGIDFSQNSL